MPVVAVFHPKPAVRTAIKRGLSRPHLRLITCRTSARVTRLLQTEPVDAVVADIKAQRPDWFLDVISLFPTVPCFAMSRFRPDDGRLISRFLEGGVTGVLVEGVDEPVAGEVITNFSAGACLARELADAPRLLRLRDDLQLRVWSEVFNRGGTVVSTGQVAGFLGITREHLSREFGAGGAPNLKRVIDLVRLVRAARLSANPGHSIGAVSRILNYSSPSHLSSAAKRLAETTPAHLAELGPRGILARFIKGKMRSRL